MNSENAILNPAMLPLSNGLTLSLLHTNLYSIGELNYNRVSFISKRVSLTSSLLGSDLYREWLLSLSFGFSGFNKYVSYGITIKGMGVSIKDYGSNFTPGIDIGVLYHTQRYTLGAILSNLNRPSVSKGDFIPIKLSLGTWFHILKDLRFGLDIVKEEGYKERVLAGIELVLLPLLSTQLGLSTNPFLLSFGSGTSFKRFKISYALRFHSQLRETHLLSLSISL